MKRAIFWAVFLLAAAAAFVHIWRTRDPLRNHEYLLPLWVQHNVRLLAHPHPAVGHDAWRELWKLYFTKWTVYQSVSAEVGNAAPISFLIERQSLPGAGENAPPMEEFFARNKPIYYKTDRVYCRTVGEAIMAIMYREKKWSVDYQGDWQAWWQANAQHYR